MAQLQTARTVAPGSGQISISAGYLYNRLNKKRSHSLANFPIEAHSRWGLIPKLDIGVSVFDLAGGQIDLKYNFLPETNPAALALSGGIGAAWDWAVAQGDITYIDQAIHGRTGASIRETHIRRPHADRHRRPVHPTRR